MIRHFWTTLGCLASIFRYGTTAAAPTWPSSMDELEDIQQLNTGYRQRGFAEDVTPCSFSIEGPGRIASAEWIRTAFHDMATGNVFLGTGGLDASLVFELGGDNIGAAFATTLTTFAPFLSSRSSMSDIIAMGLYTAVRSCGGPVVPIRTGRIDATTAGPPGVPLPQNSLYTFENQFTRMGFNTTEMIAVTACGHTLGGVHAVNFPQIVPAGTAPNDYHLFDSTTVFDEKIASEYIGGNSTDPLTVGPSKAVSMDSDARVFAADGNATIQAMANPKKFASMCTTMLQKMIEVVPSGVTLTDPIVPYDIKPVAMQLTLLGGGTRLQFTGEIRVRTTVRSASQIANVKLQYKDRTGGSACGSCNIDTKLVGTALGFDDSYSFYSFSARLPTNTSISRFNVQVTLVNRAKEVHDNNGVGFPIQDTIMLQAPESCLSLTVDANGNNNLTVVAAVRSTQPTPSVSLDMTFKVPRTGIIVPALSTTSLPMAKKYTVGPYQLYAATYALNNTQSHDTKFDVSIGSGSSRITDSFKNTGDLPTTCKTLRPTSSNTTTAS